MLREKALQAVRLCRVAIFFASSDGVIDQNEAKLIEGFKDKFSADGILLDSEISEFEELINQKLPNLQSVIQETKAILAVEPEVNVKMMLHMMTGMINSIILADGVITADESAYFNEWKKQFNIVL